MRTCWLADLLDRAQLDEVAARVGDLKHYPKAHRCEVHCREAFVDAVSCDVRLLHC